MFLFLQMFQNNNTIKTFANLQHTWKIPSELWSWVYFLPLAIEFEQKSKFVHEAEIKALAAAVPIYV